MAKDKTSNVKVISLGVAILVIAAGALTDFVLQGASIDSTKEKVVELKEEGCKPAQKHVTDISLIQQSMETFIETTQEMKTDHKEFREDLWKALKLPPTEPDSP